MPSAAANPERFAGGVDWLDRKNPNCLNFFRLVFALLVIFSHAWNLGGQFDPFYWLPQRTESIGSFAVNSFFIISGFLITASWQTGRGAESFLRSRLLRIVPGFVVAALVSIALCAVAAKTDWMAYARSLSLENVLMGLVSLDGGLADSSLAYARNRLPHLANGSLWTIAIEFRCYLAVALLGALGLLERRRFMLVFISVFGGLDLGRLFLHRDAGAGWPRFATMFGAGALMWLWRDRIPRSGLLAVLASIALVGGTQINGGLTIMLPIAGSYLLFYVAFNSPAWLRAIGSRNDISYGIYLYAFPIQQFLYGLFPTMGWIENFLGGSFIAIAAGWVSWLCVEQPLLYLGAVRQGKKA